MANRIYSRIVGTGSYIPTRVVKSCDFLSHEFYGEDGVPLAPPNKETIDKFTAITGIEERRYADDDLVTSDLAFYSAQEALATADIDKESLDYIIVAHNFGDVAANNKRSDFVPSLSARVKHRLKIENPRTIAYDLPFGCAGWLQGVIQGDYYIRSGDARRVMVIGAETLSRVTDPHDRDSMLYADGAGAAILEGIESDEPTGVISHCARSDTHDHAFLLKLQKSYKLSDCNDLLLKMQGHKVFEYALKSVPRLVKDCLTNARMMISDVSKILIHQANTKMDEAIVKRLFGLFNQTEVPRNIMPMTVSWLGNSSVATLPTLFDLLVRNKLEGHRLNIGDKVVFASVGAGMNANAMVYRLS